MLPADGSRRSATVQIAVCALLLGAFALVAAPVVVKAARSGFLLPPTPYSSTDAHLAQILPNRAFAGALTDLFAAVPRRSSVFILMRDGVDTWTLVVQLLAVLSWPHPVQVIRVRPHLLPPELETSALAASQAIVFALDLPLPPSRHADWQLSKNVTLSLPDAGKP